MKWGRRAYRCLYVKSVCLDKTMKIFEWNNALAWCVTRSIYVKEMEINDNIVVNFVQMWMEKECFLPSLVAYQQFQIV